MWRCTCTVLMGWRVWYVVTSTLQQISKQQIIIDHADAVTQSEWWNRQVHRDKNKT